MHGRLFGGPARTDQELNRVRFYSVCEVIGASENGLMVDVISTEVAMQLNTQLGERNLHLETDKFPLVIPVYDFFNASMIYLQGPLFERVVNIQVAFLPVFIGAHGNAKINSNGFLLLKAFLGLKKGTVILPTFGQALVKSGKNTYDLTKNKNVVKNITKKEIEGIDKSLVYTYPSTKNGK